MPAEAIERAIRRLANRIGIDIHRHRPAESAAGRLAAALASRRIDVVLDVGANTGQFGSALRGAGYRGRIVSFEPLVSARAALLATSARDDGWLVAPQAAIGAYDGQIDINVAGNSVSSSVLSMLPAHSASAPQSRYVATERVALKRLDDLAPDFLRPDSVAFLKIDTQGYESHVLAGAPEVLERVQGVQLELSFVPLYDGQVLFDELLSQMRASGFDIWSLWPAFWDPQDGRLLQADVVFMRTQRG